MEPEELRRYSRQIILPGFGEAGQERLRDARALIIGAGGLGSPSSLYLAAAGVGTLGMIDFDEVETHNLHRQILHDEASVGHSKLESAGRRLKASNPHLNFKAHPTRLTPANALEIFSEYDIILDGSDNFPTRYLVNDAAVLAGKPLVYGAIFQYEGQVALLAPSLGGPCYRCFFPEIPPPGAVPNCAEAGVFGALAGAVGSFQALLALRVLARIGELPVGKLLRLDGLNWRTTPFTIARDPNCTLCGENPTLRALRPENYESVSCESPLTQTQPDKVPMELSVNELHGQMASNTAPFLLDVREPFEVSIARLPGARAIPLRDLPNRIDELPRDKSLLLYCHHGMRSLKAATYLRSCGFDAAQSLSGGIERWSREIDPSVPRY